MKFLHTMIRVKDLDQSIDFFSNILGLNEASSEPVLCRPETAGLVPAGGVGACGAG